MEAGTKTTCKMECVAWSETGLGTPCETAETALQGGLAFVGEMSDFRVE